MDFRKETNTEILYPEIYQVKYSLEGNDNALLPESVMDSRIITITIAIFPATCLPQGTTEPREGAHFFTREREISWSGQ